MSLITYVKETRIIFYVASNRLLFRIVFENNEYTFIDLISMDFNGRVNTGSVRVDNKEYDSIHLRRTSTIIF